MKGIGKLIPLLALLVACRSEQEEPAVSGEPGGASPGETVVFYGTLEGQSDSKAFADVQLNVLWNTDDRVSIFAKKDVNREYRFTGEDGANAGSFEKVTGDETETGNALAYNYAVYPYSSATTVSADGAVSVTFPASQAYRENSFGPGAGTMVAVSEDNMLLFKNAGAFVSVNLYGEDIAVSKITFKGNRGEKLAGVGTVRMEPGEAPSIVMMADENVSETVTLVCSTPVAVGSDEGHATAFWFVIPPTTFSGGFTVTVEDSEGNRYEKTTSKEVAFRRSALKRMAAFELVPRGFGVYPVSGDPFVYDPDTDQMNVYEAEGNAWFRFLRIPTLEMYELGPIPLDEAVWDQGINAQLTVTEAGVTAAPADYELTVLSYRNGILNLSTAAGDQFVIRF